MELIGQKIKTGWSIKSYEWKVISIFSKNLFRNEEFGMIEGYEDGKGDI